MRPTFLALLLLPMIVSACATPAPDIDQAEVERVIGILAADAMRGRSAFSPDGMRAAEFVASEFAAIGLDPMPGLDGYLQRFGVYSIVPEAVSVTLNGRPVPGERIAASLSSPSVSWSGDDGPRPTLVGEGDSMMGAFQAARRSGEDALIVVPMSERATFDRIRGFLGRGSRTTDPGDGSDLVFVLADVPAVRTYGVEATAEVSETGLANVVGAIPGRRTDEIVLFSGHYDHIGVVDPVDGDSIANGANDDASGTAAVIELARFFKARGVPERTIYFAAFTAEESGGYGSRYFSEQLDPDEIVAMFNIEMIGKPAVEGPNTAWITGFDRSDFGAILQRAVEVTAYSFHADPYPDQNLFYRSDNATLARLGVPAHSISTTPIDVDPDYHRVSDEVETLDLAHLTATIRAIAAGAETIVTGEATPTRVDPETLR